MRTTMFGLGILAAAIAIAPAAAAGERGQRIALYSASAADLGITIYGLRTCDYCYEAGSAVGRSLGLERGGRMQWGPVAFKVGATVLVDLAGGELAKEGRKRAAAAEALAVTATTLEDWERVVRRRRDARSWLAWSKRVRIGGATVFGGAAAWNVSVLARD